MGLIDGVVFVLFVAGLLALGLSARLRDSSILQYLAAGRNLSLTAFVATLVSTWYGGILGVGESTSYYGLGTLALMGVPYYFFGLVYAFWLAPRVRGGDQISIPERFEARFGKGPAIVAACLIFLLAVPAAHVLMLGVLIRTITPLDIVPAVLIAGLVGTLFLWRGGLLADVRVALLAFVAMYVGFAAIDIWCLIHHPPAEAFAPLKGTPLWTWDGGQGPLFVLSFLILGAWTLVDPGFHQRVASAQSPMTSRRGVLLAVGFWLLFDVLTITAGLYAGVLAPSTSPNPTPLDGLESFPRLGLAILPDGLRAVFFCGMLGTIVSAMVGYALISGATVGREIVGRIRGESEGERVKMWTRAGIAFAFVIAILVGLSLESVVNLWYSWAGAVVGALLIPLAAAYAKGPLQAAQSTWTVAMVLAATTGLGLMAYGQMAGNPFLEAELAGNKFSLGTLLPALAVSALILAPAHLLAIIRKRP